VGSGENSGRYKMIIHWGLHLGFPLNDLNISKCSGAKAIPSRNLTSFNVAMENSPLIDDLPTGNCDFPLAQGILSGLHHPAPAQDGTAGGCRRPEPWKH